MDRSKLISEVTAIHSERCGLLMGKSQDYASEDVLANFKRMNILCAQLGIQPARSPADAALFLALLKLDRICNLKNKGTEPKNESVRDSYMDAHNYLDLAYSCDIERTIELERARKSIVAPATDVKPLDICPKSVI